MAGNVGEFYQEFLIKQCIKLKDLLKLCSEVVTKFDYIVHVCNLSGFWVAPKQVRDQQKTFHYLW